MGLTYLDSCVLIYAFDDRGPLGDQARQALRDSPTTEFAVSPLVRLECLVRPLREKDDAWFRRFGDALSEFSELPIDGNTFNFAAHIRANTNLKTPDALHLATARLSDCDELWTNDSALAAAAPEFALNVFAS